MGTELSRETQSKSDINTMALQANARLYEDSCQKFGKQNVDAGHFNKNDLAEMTAVAVLGPGACQALGHDRTKLAGAAMVSIVAPALIGGIDEGKKHFQERPMETVNKGCGNILTGAAGAAIFSFNPLIATGLAACGGGLFINDQLNSTRNRARNSELSKVFSNLHNMDNSQLLQAGMKVKPYLGPDAYEAAFVTATSGIGLKPGQKLGTEIKSHLNTGALAAQTKQLATMLTGTIEHLASGRQPKLAMAGVLLSEKSENHFDISKVHWPFRLPKYEGVSKNKALGQLNELIEANPNEPPLYHTRAREHMRDGQLFLKRESFENALKDLNRYLQLKPNEPHGLIDRAQVYLELGNSEKAMSDFCQAIPRIKIGDDRFAAQLTSLEARLNPHRDLSEAQLARALSPETFPHEPKPAHLDQLKRIYGAKLARFLSCEIDKTADPTSSHLSQLKSDFRQLEHVQRVEQLHHQGIVGKGDHAAIARSRLVVEKLNDTRSELDRAIFGIRTEVEPDKLLSELHHQVASLHKTLAEHPTDRGRIMELQKSIAWVENRRPRPELVDDQF